MSISIDSDIGRNLDRGLRALGLDATLAGPLLAYLDLLDRWNHTYNLTAVRDPRDMVGKHLLDSLAMVPFAAAVTTLADLGSGPGLPGIPLAIALPALRVTLVESNGKKARFLREAVRTLALDNARVAECRAEALDEPGAYQAITARALATLPQIVAVGGHLLEAQGQLLAMKGARPDDEVATLPPGWQLHELHRLQVPGLTAERHLAVVGRVAGGGGALRA